jgi:hypothetical protein
MQAHLHALALKVSDQVLDQTQCLFIERKLFQIASQEASHDCRIRPQPNLFSGSGLGAQKQAKVAYIHQAFSDKPKAAHSEVGCGHIQRAASMLGQQVPQNIGQNVGLVVYDVWQLHRF